MARIWKHIAWMALAAGLGCGAQAQQVGARASLESDTALIGDQLWFTLELTVPKGSKVTWPMFSDTLVNRLEILRRSATDTVAPSGDHFTLRQQLLLTAFEEGEYVIPPIPFQYLELRDTTKYYTETRPLTLVVNTPEIDEAGDIKPIKPPLKAPVTFAELAPWLAVLLALLLIAAGIYYYIRKKKARQPVFQIRSRPRPPAHQVALDALEQLRQKKLWQAGRVKDYYTELTEIVRTYIEERYKVMALEMTTEEILSALRNTDAGTASKEKLHSALVSADLVKFAKYRPLPDENDRSFHQCLDFVKETRPVTDLRQAEDEVELMKNRANS